jgi:hypothetical protein
MAERGGFEPPIRVTPYDGLANRCLKPLGHLSRASKAEKLFVFKRGGITNEMQQIWQSLSLF